MGFIMPQKDTITFILDQKLKEDFDSAANANGMKMSYALRQLMVRFIENPTILSRTPSDISVELENKILDLQRTTQKQIDEQTAKIDLFIDQAAELLGQVSTTQSESLTEVILGILKEDSEVQKQTYETIEKAIIKNYAFLKPKIEQSKSKGENPVGDAINELRDLGLVKYNRSTKRLKWGE